MWRISKAGRLDRLVVFRWHGGGYFPAGELTFEGAGEKRIGRFGYARSYLALDGARAVDPLGLPLVRRSFPGSPEELPLAFYDAGPDGWGKQVLQRAFPRTVLSMPEYLALGGIDRTGDLAFRRFRDCDPRFLASGQSSGPGHRGLASPLGGR